MHALARSYRSRNSSLLLVLPAALWAAAPSATLVGLAALGGCSTEEPGRAGNEAGTPGLTPGAPAQGSSRTIAVQCTSDDAIEAPVRAAVVQQARSLYGALHEGKPEALWDALHPQARKDDQRQPFMEALTAVAGRLEGAPAEPGVERVHFVDLRGGTNALARVQCGAEDDDERFTLLLNAGDEDVAVVVMRTPQAAEPGRVAADSLAITVQLRRRGERWHLLGVQVNPATYRGKDAGAYEALADLAMSQKKVVVAYLMLGLAQTLSDRGASITSATHARIEEKLAAIARDRLLPPELGTWTVGDAHFRIEGLSLVSTRRDISPVIKYVSPQGLVEELLDRDADVLVQEVRQRFPELEHHFDAVVFEAYAEAPTEPGRSYQAYRLVRPLDPAATATSADPAAPKATPEAGPKAE
jgi:hypothetical protein